MPSVPSKIGAHRTRAQNFAAPPAKAFQIGHYVRVSRQPGLETFHFAPLYEVRVDPEFPGDGDWGCPVFEFSGGTLHVEVTRADGSRWIGRGFGGTGSGITTVCACPNPNHLCVVSDGEAALIDVRAPDASSGVKLPLPVTQVVAVHGQPFLLLATFTDLVAVGNDGVAWRSRRLGFDDLIIRRATGEIVECSVDSLEGIETIVVDLASGEQLSGRRFPH